jgi:tight adherence protein B
MFFFVAFLLFSGAFLGTGYYLWTVPRNAAALDLDNRLRSVRSSARSVGDRVATDLLHRESRSAFASLGDFVSWLGFVAKLEVYIRQANLKWRAADVLAVSVGIAVLGYLLALVLIPIFILQLVLAFMLGAIPTMVVVRKRNARLSKFEQQLPDAIDLFTRTMRAGHNIHSGLETIAEETTDPIKMEFRKVIEELALGSSIDAALHKLGQRIPIIDLKFFITGLILQRQTGANMVDVLENLATLVRERLNIAGKMKAHTASQRFSAGLLCILPLVVGVGFFFLKPEYVMLLWNDPLGTKFLTYAIISEIVGILVIRQLSNIKV